MEFDWQTFAALLAVLVLPPLGGALRCAMARERVQARYGDPIDQLRADIEGSVIIPEIRDMLQDIPATVRLSNADDHTIQRQLERKLQDVANLGRWQRVREAYAHYLGVEKRRTNLVRLIFAQSAPLLLVAAAGIGVAYSASFNPSGGWSNKWTCTSLTVWAIGAILWIGLLIPELITRNRLSGDVNPQG